MKKWLSLTIICLTSVFLFSCNSTAPDKKLRALIIDGQNNHGIWAKSTQMMKSYLLESGRFDVDIYRAEKTWKGGKFLKQYPLNDGKKYQDFKEPQANPNFKPNFANYDVVVSNFGWKAADWPEETKNNFVDYMKNGGGLVVVHAANNSFGDWAEYNKMIGIGGWGGRNHNSGPYIYYKDDNNELIRDTSKGGGGGHGPQHEFVVQTRDAEHPIMKGIPEKWMQAKDELYNKLRGPAENLTVLASAFDKKKTQRHEPVLMAINYHKGRVFHTTLGHAQPAFESVGFITTVTRGTEWAASGKVTIPVPADFPTENKSSKRKFDK